MAKSRKARLAQIFRKLCNHCGAPEWKPSGPAIDSLILTVLSQNTNDRNSLAGFNRLKAKFSAWAAVEKARWQSIAAAIKVSGLNNIKARRIKDILRRIREDRGDHSLEFLKRWQVERARTYLISLPGVGPKTAACVLLFSFGMPAFPVDTHIHRVTRRLSLIDESTTAEEAHLELQALTPDPWVYPLHMLIIRHGREICRACNPKCSACVLLRLCPWDAAAN